MNAENNFHRVYVSIGSNIDRAYHIQSAIETLDSQFDNFRYSPIYETPAVGFDGDNFYNLVASFDTSLTFRELEQQLKWIEDNSGRDRNVEKFSARTLDIDLLLYDQQILLQQGINIPRDEILRYAFVLRPLADLQPDLLHPQTGKTMAFHWQQMQKNSHEDMNMVPVTLESSSKSEAKK